MSVCGNCALSSINHGLSSRVPEIILASDTEDLERPGPKRQHAFLFPGGHDVLSVFFKSAAIRIQASADACTIENLAAQPLFQCSVRALTVDWVTLRCCAASWNEPVWRPPETCARPQRQSSAIQFDQSTIVVPGSAPANGSFIVSALAIGKAENIVSRTCGSAV